MFQFFPEIENIVLDKGQVVNLFADLGNKKIGTCACQRVNVNFSGNFAHLPNGWSLTQLMYPSNTDDVTESIEADENSEEIDIDSKTDLCVFWLHFGSLSEVMWYYQNIYFLKIKSQKPEK